MRATHPSSPHIRAEIEGPLGTLLLDRAERKNALSLAMWAEIPKLIDLLVAQNARVIILRGARDLPFCSGADISEFETVRASSKGARDYEAANTGAYAAIGACPVPTVAMIRSFCMGGGVGLAAACDLRVASENAEFAIPAGRLGLAYPPLAIRYIVATIGAAAAKDLIYSARRIGAAEAETLGLLNRLFSDDRLESETAKLAAAIADNAPLTLRAAKLAINHASGHNFGSDQKSVIEAADHCFDSADYREGRAAFLEKRKPVFRGE